jgi:UDP-N-acetylglucosamine 2-epimerase
VKVLTVVGARPQFVKAAPFARALGEAGVRGVLVHTGQHYDPALSDIFFEELDLPRPDHHLGVGSASHAVQTARMLERLEPVIQSEAPDWVVVFGDANSTLAGALAAAKLNVPLAHVEAGLRSGNRSMPEEINRIIADHCAGLLFAPTATGMSNLENEGLAESAHLTGDIMLDALLFSRPRARREVVQRLGLTGGGYFLITIHRAANTDDPRALEQLIDALAQLDGPVVFPLHPRTKLALASGDLEVPSHVRTIEPVGYLEMLALQMEARAVLTDSGGVQKEAYLLAVPCVTLRDETEWPETAAGGWNVLTGTDARRIVKAATRPRPSGQPPAIFGDGHAASRMVQLLHDSSHRGCVS